MTDREYTQEELYDFDDAISMEQFLAELDDQEYDEDDEFVLDEY